MDNNGELWHGPAIMRRVKTHCHALIWLLMLALPFGSAQAWSTDGSAPISKSFPIDGQSRHSECHEWPVQTAQFVEARTLNTECGSRGRFNINNWPHSVSIGSPSRGALVYAEALMPNQFLTSRKHKRFGTRELVSTIERAVAVVNAKFPNTPVLHVGDLSRKNGGFFPPHLSHQSGLDVDIGYYLNRGHNPNSFRHTNRRTMDTARTWTLIEEFLRTKNVQYIFSDRYLIPLLRRYAAENGRMTPAQERRWFGGGGIIRHLKGHADHLHIRIRAPESSAAVARLENEIGRKALRRMMTPIPIYIKIRSGDSIGRIAKRAGISQRKLKKYNRLRGKSPRIYAGKRLIVGYRYPKYASAKRVGRTTRRISKDSRPTNATSAKSVRRKAKRSKRTKRYVSRGKSKKRARRHTRKHTVRSGDSLSKIAHRYRVPTAEICRINRLAKNCAWSNIRKRPIHLRIGQKLKIPQK